MANNVIEFLTNHSFKIMLTGFGITAVGIFLFLGSSKSDPVTAHYGFVTAIVGLSIYVVGRIFVFIQRKKQRKSPDLK